MKSVKMKPVAGSMDSSSIRWEMESVRQISRQRFSAYLQIMIAAYRQGLH